MEELMNSTTRIALVVTIGFALITEIGCATPKVWISSPQIQTVGNPYYEAKLEPVSSGRGFFVSFRLVITNQTDKNLEIDWNKTRYTYNGRSRGVFVFKGIMPEDIRASTVPPDIVLSGQTFLRVISPFELLARAPLRERDTSEPVISPGIIPTGRNGILLVVRQNGKEIVGEMSVDIEEKEVQ